MIKGREIKNMFLSEEKEMFASICFFFQCGLFFTWVKKHKRHWSNMFIY